MSSIETYLMLGRVEVLWNNYNVAKVVAVLMMLEDVEFGNDFALVLRVFNS